MRKSIGIDIGGTNTRVSLITEECEILEQFSFPTPFISEPVKSVKEIFRRITSRGLFEITKFLGCGLPAMISPSQGFVEFAPNLGWRNFDFKKAIPQNLKFRNLVFENDANCAAWAIYKMSKEKPYSLCVLTLGTGVGGGMILGGNLLSHPDISAFEVGHMTIGENKIVCGCGNRGCFETFCGGRHIAKWASSFWSKTKYSGKSLTPLEIQVEAQSGSAWAKSVWEKYGEYLGIGVSNIINLFAVDKVVLTGGIASAWEFFKPSLLETIKKRTLEVFLKKVEIETVEWNHFAGSIGAALLALR